MLDLIVSIIVVCLSTFWMGAVGMTPMLVVMEKNSDTPTPPWKIRLLFTYPAGLFLILYVFNIQFFWTNPLYWMVGVLVYGPLMMSIWGLPVRVSGDASGSEGPEGKN